MFFVRLELTDQPIKWGIDDEVFDESFETALWRVCYNIGEANLSFAVGWDEESLRLNGSHLATVVRDLPEIADDLSAGRRTRLYSVSQGLDLLVDFLPGDPVSIEITLNGEKTESRERRGALATLFADLVRRIDALALERDPQLTNTRSYRLWLGTAYLCSLGFGGELRDADDYEFLEVPVE